MTSRLASLLILLATSVFPATLEKLALDEMIVKSTEIVRGRVASVTSFRRGSLILTQVRLAVTERWKGADAPSVDIFLHGGTFQGLRQTFSGTPELREGAEYICFLWAGESGNRQIVGLSQGVLDIQPATAASKSGSAPQSLAAIRPAIAGMLDPITRAETADAGFKFPLDDLRLRVKRVLDLERQ